MSEEPSLREVVDNVLAQAKSGTPMGQALASGSIRVTDDLDAHTELLRHLVAMGDAIEAILQVLALEIDELRANGAH